LAPWLGGARSLDDLRALDLEAALWGDLDWSRRQELEQLLPMRLAVPSGRSVPLDYSSGEPVLAVKLQEMFSSRDTPRLLDGRLPVTLHLLNPAGRPAAITQDLPGFWAGSYREVRRELRGRYPKHPWPEDGATATPTAFTKARLQPQRE
jgi:ATP-dependent helicase HrpB